MRSARLGFHKNYSKGKGVAPNGSHAFFVLEEANNYYKRLSTQLSKTPHLPRKQLGLISHRLLQLSLHRAQLLEFVEQPHQPLPIKSLMQPRLELPSPDFPTQLNRLDRLRCLQRVRCNLQAEGAHALGYLAQFLICKADMFLNIFQPVRISTQPATTNLPNSFSHPA